MKLLLPTLGLALFYGTAVASSNGTAQGCRPQYSANSHHDHHNHHHHHRPDNGTAPCDDCKPDSGAPPPGGGCRPTYLTPIPTPAPVPTPGVGCRPNYPTSPDAPSQIPASGHPNPPAESPSISQPADVPGGTVQTSPPLVGSPYPDVVIASSSTAGLTTMATVYQPPGPVPSKPMSPRVGQRQNYPAPQRIKALQHYRGPQRALVGSLNHTTGNNKASPAFTTMAMTPPFEIPYIRLAPAAYRCTLARL
jgi:hypothetical protein